MNTLIVVLVAVALGVTTLPGAAEPKSFQSQLDLAIELNLTAPWQESQAILDRLEPELERASTDQFASFQLLRIRNLALAGRANEGLELTDQLLQRALPPEHQLNALARGANLGLLVRRFEVAFDYLYRALDLEPKVDQPELTTYVYSMAADIFRTVGVVDKAIEYGQRSVEVASKHGHLRAECVGRMRMSAAYRAGDYLDEAEEHYRTTLDICEAANDPVFFAIAEFGLGSTLQRNGRLNEAEHHLDSALVQHRNNGYVSGEYETLLSLAKLYLATQRSRLAEETLSGLIDNFAKGRRWDFLATTHRLLGDIAHERGDYTAALDHALAQIEAREHFLDVERARQLAYLEIEFESRFQEQQLALLHEQRRVSELQEQTRLQQRHLHGMAYASGGLLTIVLILLLIHARRERRHYQRLARLDSLTGLSNHTRFFDTTRMMVQDAHQTGEPLALVMGDIDHFKQVNDTHGHLAGDQALRKVAGLLRETFAGMGHVGRIGGEEFAACLPGCRVDDVRRALEAFRSRIRAIDFGADDRILTMSFGIARLSPGEPLERLRQRADQALYQAKNAGRDTIVLAPDELEPQTRQR